MLQNNVRSQFLPKIYHENKAFYPVLDTCSLWSVRKQKSVELHSAEKRETLYLKWVGTIACFAEI